MFVSFADGEVRFVCLYSPVSLYVHLQNERLSFQERNTATHADKSYCHPMPVAFDEKNNDQ